MCGLTGYFALDRSFDAVAFAEANNIIRHRGPDDHGFVTFDSHSGAVEHRCEHLTDFAREEVVCGAFGFRRLAIIDLTQAGHQPMASPDRNLWIVFNGEVYNYIEIREELIALGHRFRSDSDTEVVLTAYRQWGEDCLHRFNGMWAFAIYDTARREVFCSRDRFGIKPFNFFLDKQRFAFASESKQLMHLVPECREVNGHALFDFLVFGAKNHGEETFRAQIFELRGGECMTVSLGNSTGLSSKRRRWWDLQASRFDHGMEQAGERFLELLTDSVRIRLRSDVKTGTALSGGLDSTGIVSLIDRLTAEPQNVFTVVSNDSRSDESEFAREMIEKYGLIGHSIEFGVQPIEDLQRITWFHDQPLSNAGSFGGWILQQRIRDSGVVVNINGQGADELMGGYSRPPHFLNYLDSLKSGHLLQAHRELVSGFRNSPWHWLRSTQIMAQDIARFSLRRPTMKWVSQRSRVALDHHFHATAGSNSVYLSMDEQQFESSSVIKRQAYQQLKRTMLPSLLHNVDRDSMAHSLEARVPFLDFRIAEFVFSLPPHMLLRNGYTKYVYRNAMRGSIPDRLLWNNNKKGFTTPVNDYLMIGKDYFTGLLEEQRGDSIVNIGLIRRALHGKVSMNRALLWRCLGYLMWRKANTHTTN